MTKFYVILADSYKNMRDVLFSFFTLVAVIRVESGRVGSLATNCVQQYGFWRAVKVFVLSYTGGNSLSSGETKKGVNANFSIYEQNFLPSSETLLYTCNNVIN